MPADRRLLIVADDYGIGPGTSHGILRLCRAGIISGTVLLVNSPYAHQAVKHWRQARPPADLGWHPCLTLDAPILPPGKVKSLVDAKGHFHRLGSLMLRLMIGRVRFAEVVAEFRAQLNRFRNLVGHDPVLVNSHHHVQVFPVIGAALRTVLRECAIRPVLRCIREPWTTIHRIAGARGKRVFLSTLGLRESRMQLEDGFRGSDWLAGITDPPFVHDRRFFANWFAQIPGQLVELTCHPGEYDPFVLHRDAKANDGNLERRVQELELIRHPDFRRSYIQAGFRLVTASELLAGNRQLRIAG